MNAPIRKVTDIKFVTIHHSASSPSKDLNTLKQRAASYNQLHKAKSYALITKGEFGYDAISYHYLVSLKGDVLQVQDIKYERNHAGDRVRGKDSHNIYGVAICLDSNTSQFKVSSSAKNAIAKIIYDLEVKLKKSLIIRTHREQACNPSSGALPEVTGKIYTECAGNIMGTHKSGVCKEIINLVNELHKNTMPNNPCAEKAKALAEELGKERSDHLLTKKILEETKTELASTKTDLKESLELQNSLSSDLATKVAELNKLNGLVPTLKGTAKQLQEEVETLKAKLSEYESSGLIFKLIVSIIKYVKGLRKN